MKRHFKLPYDKIVSFKEAVSRSKSWHKQGLKLVVTSGVFDIATYKHPEYLRAAANLGDKLILRMDSDKHISLNKNPKGPIVPYNQRAKHVAHYEYIDLITPNMGGVDWIKNLKPDVAVFSITSSIDIVKKIELMRPHFNKIGTKVVVMDVEFKTVPKNMIEKETIKYDKDKYKKEHISGSKIKRKIIKRAILGS